MLLNKNYLDLTNHIDLANAVVKPSNFACFNIYCNNLFCNNILCSDIQCTNFTCV